jgi:hypothetical protein
MRSPTCYACCEKEMLGWIREKMATQESALRGGRVFTSSSIATRTTPQLATTRAFHTRIAQPPLGMVPGTTHIHSTHLAGVKGWAESQVFWCNVHNVQMGAQMAKLVTLQLVQSIGARSTMGGLIN